MSKKLEKQLLAEAFNAIAVDNDMEKATRLFKRHIDLVAKSHYKLLEAEDSEFEVIDMGDNFNDEVLNTEDDTLEQVQIAIDELEDKYTGEDKDLFVEKLNELRNSVDEMKLGEDEDGEASENARVYIEDLKADCEASDCMTEEVESLFCEIENGITGTSDCEDTDELPAEETEIEIDVEEGCGKKPLKEDELNVDDEFSHEEDGEEEKEEVEAEVEVDTEEDGEEHSDELEDKTEIIYDIEDDLEGLLEKIDELKPEEPVKEGFEKIADPRKKMQHEGEGVNKKGVNFAKQNAEKSEKATRLGVSSANTAGVSANKKLKIQNYENKGVKNWNKLEKPENKATSAKSVLGNKG